MGSSNVNLAEKALCPVPITVSRRSIFYRLRPGWTLYQSVWSGGKFVFKFGKKGNKEGDFNQPGYLSVNRDGHVMVCDSGNHRVQVFEQSGKFVTNFGTEGSGKGQFDWPESTANLSDGRIVVSDTDNHRIQLFELIWLLTCDNIDKKLIVDSESSEFL